MSFGEFLYRLKTKWEYHTANDSIQKRIAEINRNKRRVFVKDDYYAIPEASVRIPKGIVDDIFNRFDLFIVNMHHLNGRYAFDDGKLFFLFDAFKLQILSANELFIINEIFFNHCYNIKIPNYRLYNVIDIGMNVGLASLFFGNRREVNQVFSYEPFLRSYKQAMNNFELNPTISKRIKAFNFGLGNGERIANVLFDPVASGTSGVWLNNDHGRSRLEKQAVLIKDSFKTLSGVLRNEPELPFVVKMDCEGSEFEIMDSLFGAGFPEQIIAILMEWHGKIPEGFEGRILDAGFKMVNTRLTVNTGIIYATR